MYKKNISVIENALNLAQVEEGMIGDNSVIFTPSSDSNRNYESAKRFAKYLNAAKICKNKTSQGCSGVYYKGTYQLNNNTFNSNNARIILNDGSIYDIIQFDTCDTIVDTCIRDEVGNCKKDENGNNLQGGKWNKPCAQIFIDVNGAKGPNIFGKDLFVVNVRKNSIFVSSYGPEGGSAAKDIMTGKI